MKAVVAAFNQEKALVGAFSVITNFRMELFEALVSIVAQLSQPRHQANTALNTEHWTWKQKQEEYWFSFCVKQLRTINNLLVVWSRGAERGE